MRDMALHLPTLDDYRNKVINGAFNVNQRDYQSGHRVGDRLYCLDRWRAEYPSDYIYYDGDVVTIPEGIILQQTVEGIYLRPGRYFLSWSGSAMGRIGIASWAYKGKHVVRCHLMDNSDLVISFTAGTLSKVQLEIDEVTPFERRDKLEETWLCQRYYA